MKNNLLILLLLLYSIANLKSQSNASSTGSGMDWTISSGYYYSSPSKIVLDGEGQIGGSVLIQSDAGQNGVGKITLNSNSGGNIYFNTSNSLKMVLLNNGNLGIGVASPTSKLEVNGTVKATAFESINTNGDLTIGRSFSGLNLSGGGYHVLNGRLHIKTVPSLMSGDLEVDGEITSGGGFTCGGPIISQSDPTYGQTIFRTWGLEGQGDIYIEPRPGSNLYLTDQWRQAGMLNIQFGKTIFESGDVSIGTTEIRRRLTIGGSTRPYMSFYPSSTNYEFVIGSDDYGFIIYDGTLNQYRMVIDKSGNVGIGCTDTRGYKLAVNGPMIATKVMVKLQADWPDFVFSSNHKMKTLPEIEAFIKQNKHLPEVPTAKEVAEEGIDVGEMNRILLKKIEEMTLLMIEQEKRIRELEKNNNLRF